MSLHEQKNSQEGTKKKKKKKKKKRRPRPGGDTVRNGRGLLTVVTPDLIRGPARQRG